MKLRSLWFLKHTQGREQESLRDARAFSHEKLPDAPGDLHWEFAGPVNVGGRMTCLVCHPKDPDIIWAGSAAGGVWKSTNAGKEWKMSWSDRARSLNIGALAIDPHDPERLYCGTGEANLSGDSYPGVGLYLSMDGGEHWDLLAPAGPGELPNRIGVIAIDPFDSAHILIGGVGSHSLEPPGGLGGLYFSHDSGRSWKREESIFGSGKYDCHSIVFHPATKGVVFATFTEDGARNGIWRSEDGGQTWNQLQRGLPAPEQLHRTSLAIAPSNPDVIYALAADANGHIFGVFRSMTAGESWQDVSTNHFFTNDESVADYANTIAVHPEDHDTVICGSFNLHLTRDGGRRWNQVTYQNANRGEPWYAHADHHALVIPPSMPDRIYDMNDGGLEVSEDGGRTWENRSHDLAVTMYYDLDIAPTDSRKLGGGTQDNGAQLSLTGGAESHVIHRGDGGWMVFDPTDANHFYASVQNMDIYRWREGQMTNVTFVEESEGKQVWMTFIAMSPHAPNVVFAGSQRVWRTLDDGDFWDPVSPIFDDTEISALEVAPADPLFVYAGTDGGGFFRSRDGGDTWSGNLADTTLPPRRITRIETSPNDPEFLFVTIAGFGNRHVFRSRDGGWSWEDVDGGQLPDSPFNAVAIPTDHPKTVYVCGDAGVFVSFDRGEHWENATRNLPNVRVTDLVFGEENTLYAATYGRGLWLLREAGAHGR